MRLLILAMVLANAALMGATAPASAQSPYSYPWCARGGGKTSANNCYFASKEQCMQTTSGIGAFCFENPSYRPSPPDRSSGPRSRGRADRTGRR
jgi:Protein of unknown function (DUF3551)